MTSGCFAHLDLRPNRIEQLRQRISSFPDYLDLTSSNPTFQGLLFPSDVLRTAASTYWENRRYTPSPHGNAAARRAIRAFYATRTPSLDLPLDAIYLTASTSEAYNLLLALLTDPGDNLLVPAVGYPLIEYLAALHRVELRTYQLELKTDGTWVVDEQSLATNVDRRTRAVLIISPHNPTGMIAHTVLPVLNSLGLPVLCDEVFSVFTYRHSSVPPLGALYPSLPVFHLHGISKLFALPDLKLGWIALNRPAQEQYGPRLEFINDIFLGANSLIQAMLPTLFAQGMGFVNEMVGRVRKNLDTAIAQCAGCPAIEPHAPDGGYYLFPTIHLPDPVHPPSRLEEALVMTLLERAHVLVHPGYFFGVLSEPHLLISALVEPEKLTEGIMRVCAILESYVHGF